MLIFEFILVSDRKSGKEKRRERKKEEKKGGERKGRKKERKGEKEEKREFFLVKVRPEQKLPLVVRRAPAAPALAPAADGPEQIYI